MATTKSRDTSLHASPSTKAVGFAAAVLATALGLIYVVGQLAEWMEWLGSAGGPESSSTPLGIAILLTPSFLLGSAFRVLTVNVHKLARPEHRVWSHGVDSFLYAADILGYSFMSMATLFMARVFRGDGIQRTARWFLIANGMLLPFLAFQMYWHALMWGGALWAITFPGATWTLALIFRRATAEARAAAVDPRRALAAG